MIWFENLKLFLLDESNWYNFIPNANSSIETQLNAIFVFSIYFTIGVIVIKRDIRVIYVFLMVCALTWLFYRHHKREAFHQKGLENKINVAKGRYHDNYCVLPKKNNPFMNVSMGDMMNFPNRPKACKTEHVKNDIDELFDENLPREVSDIFHKNASDRQFYTNPVTTIPNDLDGFKDYVYKIHPTLKQSGQNF